MSSLDALDFDAEEMGELPFGRACEPGACLLPRFPIAHDDVHGDRDAGAGDREMHVLGAHAQLLGDGGFEGGALSLVKSLDRLGERELADEHRRKASAGVQGVR